MTPRTDWELDHVAVRGFDDGSRQRHRIEVQVGQRFGNTLPLKLFDGGLDNFSSGGRPWRYRLS
jgi:hypothetical protein